MEHPWLPTAQLIKHGFHISFPVVPKIPSILFIVLLLTTANVEKYIAELESSPARKDNIFISFGSSEMRNLTSVGVPLQSTENVFFSKLLMALTST